MKLSWEKAISTFLVMVCLAFSAVIFKAYLNGKFDSVETLHAYIAGFGLFAPLVLIFIQALQVVVPIFPGLLGCAVGAVLFGWIGGFWCNYIGICIGSIIAFFLARRFGVEFVRSLFSKGRYDRWWARAGESNSYALFLFTAILLPLFPDDFFCYFSGLTTMKPRRFISILLIAKPWCILAYSLGFSLIK